MPFHHAQGRLPGEAVAVIDIGSNSVRLVAYESHCRAPTPTFNEKALCGLGRGVATTSLLPDEGVAKAIAALKRFRALCDTMRIADIRAIATAAVRDASNGPAFLGLAEQAIGQNIELLSGEQEARLSALGVVSSIHNADGVVGDLGGGSLELAEIKCGDTGKAVTLQLGGLSLVDLSEKSPKRAAKIVRETLSKVKLLQALSGRTFYAVGGTWRALARLHMRQRQYPMNVMHNYVIPTRDALEFARLVERIEADALLSIEAVSSARRPLLAYGAAVLEEIIRQAPPKEIVMSALGVREGLLYARLPPDARREDPLIVSAREFNQLRSRALATRRNCSHGRAGSWIRPSSARTKTIYACVTPPASCPTFHGARTPTTGAHRPTISSSTRRSSASITRPERFWRWPPRIGICRTKTSFRRNHGRW